jgi:cell fate regulator YaaT (PSP1 superfamily)
MYHIDLSNLGNFPSDKEAQKKLQNKCDKTYQNIIVGNILNQHRHISACMACSSIENCKTPPPDEREIAEISCNGLLGTEFCEITPEMYIYLEMDDLIIVQWNGTYEIAKFVGKGEIVKIKRKEFGLFGEDIPRAVRKANEKDIRQFERNIDDELNAVNIFKEKIEKHKLEMKLVNIHYQFDRKKLYFFYTANGRVDFRELAKDLAANFRTRIELRQIGVRDEARKIGGVGMCGREYCCSTFLNGFRRITTQIAAEQNLTSNLSKLSGPCGKLKCCLSFEIENNN